MTTTGRGGLPAPATTGDNAMRRIERVWEALYARPRRKHAHRCKCCRKILQEGNPALWYRYGRGTYVVHAECADQIAEPTSGFTWRQLFGAWNNA